VERAQRTVARRILDRIPGAEIRWRYEIVLAGLAVSLPARELAALERVPGVVRVYPSARYGPLAGGDRPGLPDGFRRLAGSPGVIGAPGLWGPALEHAGQGTTASTTATPTSTRPASRCRPGFRRATPRSRARR
jgi:hypothetical protein